MLTLAGQNNLIIQPVYLVQKMSLREDATLSKNYNNIFQPLINIKENLFHKNKTNYYRKYLRKHRSIDKDIVVCMCWSLNFKFITYSH